MNLSLSLILLTVAGLAYFAYTGQQQTSAGAQEQLSAWQTKLHDLETQNNETEVEKAQMDKDLVGAQNRIASLTDQLQTARKTLASLQEQTAKAPPAGSAAAAAARLAQRNPNNLGDIATLIGQSYQACHLLRVEADGIIVSHAAGITKILYAYLPTPLQRRFGFDQRISPDISPEAVEYQERLRENNPP